jgi:hypothetical protein
LASASCVAVALAVEDSGALIWFDTAASWDSDDEP